MLNSQTRDIKGMVTAALFILVAVIAIWDTTNMMDSDSYVFPRTAAIGMILFSLLLIAWNLIKVPEGAATPAKVGSTPRRIALVAFMLASAGMMPFVGFLISGVITFLAVMVVAMYDPWTKFRLTVYPLVAVAIVAGFYGLFAKVLLVPLPEGAFFQ